MSETATRDDAIQAERPKEPNGAPDSHGKPRGSERSTELRKILGPLASLQLTCVLFVLSVMLVFFGTLAQVEIGIDTAVAKYFRSYFVWVPFQIFAPFLTTFFGFEAPMRLPGSFPFFGGWLLGAVLLANLLSAHAVRFKISWKRSGILLIHSGLIIMMLGELITGLYQVEANMTLAIGETANYVENSKMMEVAVIDKSDPKVDRVVAIPEAIVRQGGRITHPDLPFDLHVDEYMVNADFQDVDKRTQASRATVGTGREMIAVAIPEVSGTDPEGRSDIPTAYVALLKKGTEEKLDTVLLSLVFNRNVRRRNMPMAGDVPQSVRVDGKPYDLFLRWQRLYKPYAIHLENFEHKQYIGTDTAKDFRSHVHVTNPEDGTDRKVQIYMNHPLRYHGETFYQSGWLPPARGTVLQVVRNPGWLMPYFSCAIVAVGMLVHFGMNLVQFLRVKGST